MAAERDKHSQQLNHEMYHYTSHKEAVLVPVSVSHICIFHFFTQFCWIAPQSGSISRGLIELCFHVKAISSAKCF